ncbi:MAG: zinc transporter ZntB [Hyphomicrobiales bacterium]|nr:zinc transporter ZntB [Hyphomicrobiales bacterium]
MPNKDGLICAYRVGADGSAAPLDWGGVEQSGNGEGWGWVHLKLTSSRAKSWLRTESGLPDNIVAALLSPETRPRCDATRNGLLLNLRGVNLNKGAEAEDMVSIRLWIGPDRIISTRRRRLMAVQELRDRLDTGAGPESMGDFVIDLINGLLDRTGYVIDELDERLDDLEETARDALASEARKNLLGLRRRAILLRRYLSPQRDALAQLVAMRSELFDEAQRGALREISDRVVRFVEELEALRDRSAVIQDEVTTRLAEQMNTAMYRLSVIASIFLPLSLFTGLLGINVAGIPGSETSWAFWAVCALLIVLAGISIWIIRHLERTSSR